jgi:glycosyltransferase involved in cell wall biosynthesis
MLSILTITFQRHHILEEAIQSYLNQDYVGESEMVIVNDSPQVMYRFDHPNIRIINWPWRFPSIGKKLEFGFKLCSGDFVFRLDDDDLLMPNALTLTQAYIDEKPDQDVYRSRHFYQFGDNKFEKISDGINNGNVLSREYINRLNFPDKSADEDLDIVFSEGVKMYTADYGQYCMIYRWGMDTYHISTKLDLPDKERLKFIKEKEHGFIDLVPHFDHDYYGQIPK